jgi:hypothetical protein
MPDEVASKVGKGVDKGLKPLMGKPKPKKDYAAEVSTAVGKGVKKGLAPLDFAGAVAERRKRGR